MATITNFIHLVNMIMHFSAVFSSIEITTTVVNHGLHKMSIQLLHWYLWYAMTEKLNLPTIYCALCDWSGKLLSYTSGPQAVQKT